MRSENSMKDRAMRAFPPLTSLAYLLRGYVSLSRLEKHECNICRYTGHFSPFGDPPRRGAVCPACGSVERHRLIGLWVESQADIVEGAKILHFAPEPRLTALFRARSSAYQSADLDPRNADIALNIEEIELPDDSIDLVVCSHVLEHVQDSKALSEINRILKPGGRAILMFPIVEGWDATYEDPAHISEAERTQYYGQGDHVRMFGRDVRKRIEDAGFVLSEFTAIEPLVARYGLLRGEKVFIGTKP